MLFAEKAYNILYIEDWKHLKSKGYVRSVLTYGAEYWH